MSYSNDNRNAPRDAGFKPAGIGHHFGWSCMGCNQRRSTTAGSKDTGPRRRCAQCVAERKVKA